MEPRPRRRRRTRSRRRRPPRSNLAGLADQVPGKVGKHRKVAFHEGMVAELRRMDPAHLIAMYGRGGAASQVAEVEVEADPAVGIDVGQGAPQGTDHDLDANLLAHLPSQTGLDGLARMAFPAGEFPPAPLVIAALPPGDQNLGAVPENSGRDLVGAHQPLFPGRDARFCSRSRKATVRCQASLAASGRYPPQGLSSLANACPAPG